LKFRLHAFRHVGHPRVLSHIDHVTSPSILNAVVSSRDRVHARFHSLHVVGQHTGCIQHVNRAQSLVPLFACCRPIYWLSYNTSKSGACTEYRVHAKIGCIGKSGACKKSGALNLGCIQIGCIQNSGAYTYRVHTNRVHAICM
jgi:hypothetical protein